MAAADTIMQNFLLYRIGPTFLILWFIYYFRAFLKYHTYQRAYAWILNGIEWRINKALKKEKMEVFDHLSKLRNKLNRNLSVLEIGAGSAPNLHLLPSDSEVVCLEPNPHFNKYIETNLKKSTAKVTEVTVVHGFAENMDIEDERFDAVVCTLVLCTVQNPAKSLSEIKRVLKPGGIFIFVEHVAAEKGTYLRKFQGLVNPLWRIMGDGCEIVRDTADMIRQTGFSSVEVKKFISQKMKMPLIKTCILGVAVK